MTGGEIQRLVEDAPMRDRLLPPLRMTLLPIGCKGDIRFAANLQGGASITKGRLVLINDATSHKGEQCEARGGRPGVHWRGGIHRGEILRWR